MNIDLDLWKKRKKELHLTFDALADLSNVSRRQLLYLFNGEGKNTGIETVQRVERALGINETLELTDEQKQLYDFIAGLSQEEVKELSSFVDYVISKRK